jgi:chromosome segregation protein
MVTLRQRVAQDTHRVHEIQLERSRLQQQAEQSSERARSLEQDLTEISVQEKTLNTQLAQAQDHFALLNAELAQQQQQFTQVETDGERITEQAQAARSQLRELERVAQEAEFATRAIQARILDLQDKQQLAGDQSQRASAELTQVLADLRAADATTTQANLK